MIRVLCKECGWALVNGECIMCPEPVVITDDDAGDTDPSQFKEGAD